MRPLYHSGDLVVVARKNSYQVGDIAAYRYGPGDLVARLGEDEFAVMLEDVTRADVTGLARHILRAVHEPLTVNGSQITVSARVGVAEARSSDSANDLSYNAPWPHSPRRLVRRDIRARTGGRPVAPSGRPPPHRRGRRPVPQPGALPRAGAGGVDRHGPGRWDHGRGAPAGRRAEGQRLMRRSAARGARGPVWPVWTVRTGTGVTAPPGCSGRRRPTG